MSISGTPGSSSATRSARRPRDLASLKAIVKDARRQEHSVTRALFMKNAPACRGVLLFRL